MAKKTIKARVLGGFQLDGVQYNPNDIIESDQKLINSLGNSVDQSKEAVDYCLKQEKPVIKVHEFKEPELPKEPEQPVTGGNADGNQGADGK